MTAIVLRADARSLPLPDESVDLIVTSPPYFGQRSYSDGGEHYDGQIGSEPKPQEFLEALWEVTRECWRVLKPTGSMFVNLGDKRSGSGAPGTTSGFKGFAADSRVQGRRSGLAIYTTAAFGRAKSKQLLPHRYAIGCEDGLADPEGIGWVMRQELVWSKPNGLPESVRDRCRDSHEYWFHLTKQGEYFSAVDEIRQPHADTSHAFRGGRDRADAERAAERSRGLTDAGARNGLGKLPTSVWSVATEPLTVPKHLGIEHFAAFPIEWPRRLILGWTPSGICTTCDTGRFPVVDKQLEVDHFQRSATGRRDLTEPDGNDRGMNGDHLNGRTKATIVGYACACTPYTDHPGTGEPSPTAGPDGRQGERPAAIGDRHRRVGPWREYHFDTPLAPTRPAVVLDPFGGTGTTAMVARAMGRIGISVDLSADYCRLARWRIFESGHGAKVESRTNADRQGVLL